MGFRGIKNRIFVQFWILFFLSMLLMDLLVLFISLEISISRYISQRRVALTIACENRRRLAHENGKFPEIPNTFANGDRFFFTRRIDLKPDGEPALRRKNKLEEAVYQTLESGQPVTRKVGITLGLMFLQHKSVIITYPVKAAGRTVAAGGLASSLTAIYQDFRRIQKIGVVFVVINSFLFALFGNRQLSRIYFRPLKRLAKRAETYQDEDSLFFAVRKEDNEFAILSTALNKMLHRIAEDKGVLKETIGSLKEANVELQKAQNDVIRAEKLATVGRLTSGIAHEIGNPIGIVLGYLDLLKQPDLSPEERGDFIARSEKEITRINQIIRQLLDMSRPSAAESKPVALHRLLSDLVSVFNYQPAANSIVFDFNLMAADDVVTADPDQLRQVFLNILLNAVDAVNNNPTGNNRITLSSEAASGDRQVHGDGIGSFIRVSIQDNGPGIQAAHLTHVFDPFFTTKPPGKGTGLGLSVSFMIVEKLGGHLSVVSAAETGTIFHITLPLSKHLEEGVIE
jgi:two-component system, NtrC family, sensor kinase